MGLEQLRRIAIELFVLAAVGTLLGLLAPFGSAGLPSPWRLFFWVGFVLAGYLIFRPVAAVARWLTEETRVPRWLAVPLVTVVASLPLATLIAFALTGLTGDDLWDRFPLLYGQVAMVGICIQLLMLLVFAPAPAQAGAASAEETAGTGVAQRPEPGESPFLRRLPPSLGSDLLSLQMQDHYVQARTALGTTLILMRFRDAVAELGDRGVQVHRSWWAAFGAMEALERDGRSARLRLRGGFTLPVSRAFLPAVREALHEPVRVGFDRRAGSFKSPGQGEDARGTITGIV